MARSPAAGFTKITSGPQSAAKGDPEQDFYPGAPGGKRNKIISRLHRPHRAYPGRAAAEDPFKELR